jgi:hypothetical protein
MPKNCVLFELQAKGKPNYKEPHAANTASAKCGEKHQSEGVVCTTNMQTELLALFFLSHFLLNTSFKLASTNTGFLHLVWNL